MNGISFFNGNNLFDKNITKQKKLDNHKEEKNKTDDDNDIKEKTKTIKEFGDAKVEMIKILAKIKNISRKIARGKKITGEEKKFLMEESPDTLRKAEAARQEGLNIERQLKQAKTKKDIQRLKMQATTQINSTMDTDEVYGELLTEAINQAFDKTNQDFDENGQESPLLNHKDKKQLNHIDIKY